MHFTGTIWRPPYEVDSLLLEATAGCTHRACKFCTLYADLPFKFKASPLETIEADLAEAQMLRHNPESFMLTRLRGTSRPRPFTRVFLTGANPFALKTGRLLDIADLIKQHLPSVESIGCFARITDSARKTDDDLRRLREAGFNRLTIGVETGDDDALAFMNKGYTTRDILEQCRRLERAGIEYAFFYLAGISGKGHGEEGARRTADAFNQLHPFLVGSNMLTVYPNSQLYRDIRDGRWEEESELEKYREVRTLIERLSIPVQFAAMGASNAFPLWGNLPEDKARLVRQIDQIIEQASETDLRSYRENLPHL